MLLNWQTSIGSGATWVTRTSSPWLAWSILNSFILLLVAGTDSCAPGGGTMDTEMCSSCIIDVMNQSISTTGTVTPPYQGTDVLHSKLTLHRSVWHLLHTVIVVLHIVLVWRDLNGSFSSDHCIWIILWRVLPPCSSLYFQIVGFQGQNSRAVFVQVKIMWTWDSISDIQFEQKNKILIWRCIRLYNSVQQFVFKYCVKKKITS